MLDKRWGALSLFRCNDRTRGGDMPHCSMRVWLASAVLLAGAATYANAEAPPKTADTSKGLALTDARGMTLYIFDKDSGGKSACTGKCAENWPPLMADPTASAPAGYSLVTRDDGRNSGPTRASRFTVG